MPRFTRLFLLSLPLWLLALASGAACAQAPAAQAVPASAAEPIRVLFVGNSLTYANNMPRILGAIARSQSGGPAIETSTYALPGAELDDLWDDGHAAEALRSGDFDVVVLQELGGLANCFRPAVRDADCRRSAAAQRHFIELATEKGARVLLFMTWSRTRGDNDWKGPATLTKYKEFSRERHETMRRAVSRDGDRVEILPAAIALYDFAESAPQSLVLADRMHPTTGGSIIIAAQLYGAITGQPPQPADLLVDFPLLPPEADVRGDSPMETQPQIAGDGSRYLVKADVLTPLYAIARGASSP